MTADAARLQAEAAQAREAQEAARLTAESERARQAAEALRASANRQLVASAAGAAVPRAVPNIRAVLSATAPGQTMTTTSIMTYARIEDGMVRISASQHNNAHWGNFRCAGVGAFDAALGVPEIEIQCLDQANGRNWIVKFSGTIVERAGRHQMTGTLTAPNGTRHEITFR